MNNIDLFIQYTTTTTRKTQYITRLQATNQVLNGYTVASHAQQCAMIYIALCTIHKIKPSNALLIALITHDNMEVFTGDLLAPTKNANSQLWEELERRIQYDYLESICPEHNDAEKTAEVATLFPIESDFTDALTEEEYTLLKTIDCFELFLRCMEEYTSGNTSAQMTSVLSTVAHYLEDLYMELYRLNNDTIAGTLQGVERRLLSKHNILYSILLDD